MKALVLALIVSTPVLAQYQGLPYAPPGATGGPWSNEPLSAHGAKGGSNEHLSPPLGKCTLKSAAQIEDPKRLMPELSGIAVSRVHKGIYWVHNDSGGLPTLYALDEKGKLRATLELSGAKNRDWEDITSGTHDGSASLFISDAGNNNGDRRVFQLYVVAEPLKLGGTMRAPAQVYNFSYADGAAYNSEGLAWNAYEKRLYLVTKGAADVYAFPVKLTNGMKIEKLCTLKDFYGLATALDVSSNGWSYLVRANTGEVYEYAGCNKLLTHNSYAKQGYQERQGEAVAYTPGDSGFVSISEGILPKLYVFQCGE